MMLLASTVAEDINFFEVGMALFGGLALFLFGMSQMTEAFTKRMAKIILAAEGPLIMDDPDDVSLAATPAAVEAT